MCFVDDYSSLSMIYVLKQKSDAVRGLEQFLADSAYIGNVGTLRTDNVTEFLNAQFKDVLSKNRIKHQRSSPYSSHQNGTIGRMWKTLFDMARCLIIETGLHKYLWTYAVMTASYLWNRCYNQRINKPPFEAVTRQKPYLSNMHFFGTRCFVYMEKKKKLDLCCEQGVFVGYDKGSPAYLVYFPDTGEVKRVGFVKFTEKFERRMKPSEPVSEVEPNTEENKMEAETEEKK